MSFSAQCTPSSRASGASSALGLPKPLCLKRKGVDLAHACDTADHSILCVFFSCCVWKPNEAVLAADPSKLEERYVWVLERKVSRTSNVRWICMGCRVQATSGITRLRNHLTCVKKAGAQVRRYSARCAFPLTETLPRSPVTFPSLAPRSCWNRRMRRRWRRWRCNWWTKSLLLTRSLSVSLPPSLLCLCARRSCRSAAGHATVLAQPPEWAAVPKHVRSRQGRRE